MCKFFQPKHVRILLHSSLIYNNQNTHSSPPQNHFNNPDASMCSRAHSFAYNSDECSIHVETNKYKLKANIV